MEWSAPCKQKNYMQLSIYIWVFAFELRPPIAWGPLYGWSKTVKRGISLGGTAKWSVPAALSLAGPGRHRRQAANRNWLSEAVPRPNAEPAAARCRPLDFSQLAAVGLCGGIEVPQLISVLNKRDSLCSAAKVFGRLFILKSFCSSRHLLCAQELSGE